MTSTLLPKKICKKILRIQKSRFFSLFTNLQLSGHCSGQCCKGKCLFRSCRRCTSVSQNSFQGFDRITGRLPKQQQLRKS